MPRWWSYIRLHFASDVTHLEHVLRAERLLGERGSLHPALPFAAQPPPGCRTACLRRSSARGIKAGRIGVAAGLFSFRLRDVSRMPGCEDGGACVSEVSLNLQTCKEV